MRIATQERIQVPSMQVRACHNKNRATNKKMLKQRLTGLALIMIPLLIMWFALAIGEQRIDITFALIPWLLGRACLVSKEYILNI